MDKPENSAENQPVLDPRLIQELSKIGKEDSLITEYGTQGETTEQPQYDITEQWFPEKDKWQGKTIIHPRQAQALAGARILCDVFPELEPIESQLIDMINNYEMYLTSIDGKSRDQQTRVLQSMFGEPVTEEDNGSLLAQFLSTTKEESE